MEKKIVNGSQIKIQQNYNLKIKQNSANFSFIVHTWVNNTIMPSSPK
jgi:hypothetical protein